MRTHTLFTTLTAVLFAVGSVLASSCAPTTRVVAAWKDPEVRSVSVQRPLVVFQHSSEAMRRSVEDALAQKIPGAAASYELVGTAELGDVDAVREEVQAAGFDTVILARLVAAEERVDVIPGAPRPTYSPLWGAWGFGWSSAYSPTYLDKTTVVTLETLVYSLDPRFGSGQGELVFASRSETFDPRSTEDLAGSVVKASLKAMEREGLVLLTNDTDGQR